ncbi:MAG: tRNA 4-thiouridine(8) synthase ThiI [Bacteroidetes bacterium]|nr:tRNA 4-thiouridine(8) synthase ThiI [Bacteroidota bacterium]
MKPTHIICHYSEIGLKGKNRKFFEDRLRDNIKKVLNTIGADVFQSVHRIYGRILVKLSSEKHESLDDIKDALQNTFGIAYFAFVCRVPQKMENIIATSQNLLSEEKFETFRITSRRVDKNFPLNSQKVNEEVGAGIIAGLDKKVKLKNPDITCYVDIVDRSAFVYTKRFQGPGGLPVGVSGKTIVMISGGIDSPVAAFYAMKRGATAIFIHFHSVPYTNRASIDKVRELIQVLRIFQTKCKLYLVQFSPIQREIMVKTKARYRVVLYRRFMFRIAHAIAKKEKAHAIFTGESLGQVASQTLENMETIEAVTTIPIMRPLIGLDKQEIVDMAKRLGTFEISILPDQDCCSLFVPKHPATKSKIDDLEKEEEKLDVLNLVEKAILDSDIEFIK